MKTIKGIVFDFNGTLFQDSDINEKTWRETIKKYFNEEVSDEDFMKYFHGINARETLEHYAGRAVTDEEVETIVENGKEQLYREYIRTHPERQVLTSGAEKFLDKLKASGIPYNIATASAKENVDFFFEYLGLGKWFDRERIIYDDGTFRGKPEPEIYLKGCSSIGLSPEECVIFEDAYSGIESACRAGAGMIIGVDPSGKNELDKIPAVDKVIADFSQIDF